MKNLIITLLLTTACTSIVTPKLQVVLNPNAYVETIEIWNNETPLPLEFKKELCFDLNAKLLWDIEKSAITADNISVLVNDLQLQYSINSRNGDPAILVYDAGAYVGSYADNFYCLGLDDVVILRNTSEYNGIIVISLKSVRIEIFFLLKYL